MMREHLSEEELQSIAMGQQNAGAETKLHIESCTSCQQQIAVYKIIVSGINEQPAAIFDSDLENAVLQQLQPAKKKIRSIPFRPVIIAAFVTVPLYLFRNNFLQLANGISAAFLLVSIIACAGIIAFKAINMFRNYERQVEKLNISE